MRDIKSFLANLSHHPGIYQMIDAKGAVIYVGKAKDIKKRISSYFNNRNKDPKTALLMEHVQDIDFTITSSENEAVILECNLIKKHHPRFNVLLRDDKSYPYILITTQHTYPRIDLYRGPRKKVGMYFGPYPSAYSVRETISLLQKIFQLRTCRDSYFAARTRPCLLYQIGRCSGPCVGLISKAEYEKNVQLAIMFLEGKSQQVVQALQVRMEDAAQKLNYEQAVQYRDQINRLRQIQDKQYVSVAKGNADVIGCAMQAGIICIQLMSIRGGQVLDSRSYFPIVPPHADLEEIIASFITQHYLTDTSHVESIPREVIIQINIAERELMQNVLAEQVGHKVTLTHGGRGEKKKWLNMALASAKQSLAAHLFNKINMEERVQSLELILGLQKPLKRIECFDISHSMGEATVASCVVFDQNGPIKSNYRRFNIVGVTPGNDVAAMRQVLLRRFKRLQKEGTSLPDVILIDGGLTQLSAAYAVMAELDITDVLLVGVAKGKERKAGFETLHINHQPPIHLPADSLALLFIQQIRDEAHRFAITGHRQRRDKARRQSSLELVPGIGAKRRRDLLRYFGGIQGIARASLDELSKVPGISRLLAERIFATLHDTTI